MLGLFSRDLPAIDGPRIHLRVPFARDYSQWATLRAESRSFLEPWEPKWVPDELTYAAFRQRLRRYRNEFAQGSGVSFVLLEKDHGRLVGGISLTNIRRGVSQSAHVGYWMGERYAGKGMMSEALNLIIPFSFSKLRLHRLEAACIPDNRRSISVLEKAGFQREGLLRSYLRINGSWQDHVLYALIAGEHEIRRG